ncbi:lytic transglycosylase domain-containing protein [Aquimarina sp. AD10]|uniref:lytic transglycosylase domain-containing protein n=1 Tax=Aquimarina sp. AD10 TaxID=1714849 RepID=UPI000E4D401C|nr:lytic transglycosylase domain-containing protein [Aquimarina sp. AD10]AXT60173.1 lytic transglycosylase domain-containing protein [Aquimarina sp. AD10]RKN00033.1 lytic transglycosylase domain-containing protein [Aquimarina sp. AD10]
MKMIKKILVFLGILFTFSILVNATQDAPQKPLAQEVLEDKLINDYNVYAIPMPDNLNFSGELVPIENPDIRERMDRELLVNTYWQSNGLLLFKRANKYFPIIEPILKEEGVPDDFKYLAVIESSLTQAVSPARATGFWQILKGTAKEYGLEVNQNVDERYHIEKSTRVACKYLKSAKKKFGSWTLAAAAYNAGRAGVNRQLERQNAVSYYDLLLGEETGRYVFRIVAVKEILSNPKKYGFNFTNEDLYKHIPTFKVLVEEQITDFNEFAKKHNINYKILKLHNPWLREAHLNNTSGKEYYIQIPREGYYKTGTGQ